MDERLPTIEEVEEDVVSTMEEGCNETFGNFEMLSDLPPLDIVDEEIENLEEINSTVLDNKQTEVIKIKDQAEGTLQEKQQVGESNGNEDENAVYVPKLQTGIREILDCENMEDCDLMEIKEKEDSITPEELEENLEIANKTIATLTNENNKLKRELNRKMKWIDFNTKRIKDMDASLISSQMRYVYLKECNMKIIAYLKEKKQEHQNLEDELNVYKMKLKEAEEDALLLKDIEMLKNQSLVLKTELSLKNDVNQILQKEITSSNQKSQSAMEKAEEKLLKIKHEHKIQMEKEIEKFKLLQYELQMRAESEIDVKAKLLARENENMALNYQINQLNAMLSNANNTLSTYSSIKYRAMHEIKSGNEKLKNERKQNTDLLQSLKAKEDECNKLNDHLQVIRNKNFFLEAKLMNLELKEQDRKHGKNLSK